MSRYHERSRFLAACAHVAAVQQEQPRAAGSRDKNRLWSKQVAYLHKKGTEVHGQGNWDALCGAAPLRPPPCSVPTHCLWASHGFLMSFRDVIPVGSLFPLWRVKAKAPLCGSWWWERVCVYGCLAKQSAESQGNGVPFKPARLQQNTTARTDQHDPCSEGFQGFNPFHASF